MSEDAVAVATLFSAEVCTCWFWSSLLWLPGGVARNMAIVKGVARRMSPVTTIAERVAALTAGSLV